MPTVVANGISIYYERSGAGPPLLFCNGSGSTLAASGLLITPFAERCDVVAHDQRGLGRTEIPPTPYSMAQYAADAIGLLDAVGWDRCRVVGISFGGMVAQELAVTWPERVERLALLSTSPGGASASSYPLHDLAELPAVERQRTFLRLLDSRFAPEWLADHPADRGLAELVAGSITAEKSDEHLRGEAGQVEARSHHDVVDRLPRITCPTFVASGRYDGIAPPENGEVIAKQVPHGELRIYDGGHAFVAQDHAAFPEILDFLTAPAGA
jgi:pimeloyl-ACP methyl ester carboxylesterase